MGTSMAGFLLPSLVLLLTATELRWVVALINTKLIFYPHLGFQGICSWARDLEFWQPDRGVQLCGGGEKCFQGVKTGHKVCRKCLIKLSLSISPEWSVKQNLLQNRFMCQLGELYSLIKYRAWNEWFESRYTLRRTVCWEEFLALDSKEAIQQQVQILEESSSTFHINFLLTSAGLSKLLRLPECNAV